MLRALPANALEISRDQIVGARSAGKPTTAAIDTASAICSMLLNLGVDQALERLAPRRSRVSDRHSAGRWYRRQG